MAESGIEKILKEQLVILDAAAGVLRESRDRVQKFYSTLSLPQAAPLTVEQRESCEALTARFARLSDFLFQRVFRTVDRIELVDEGTAIDRLNRMEKRGVIGSALQWRELRELRNQIAHEYLIEKSDRVLLESFEKADALFSAANQVKAYVLQKGYLIDHES